MADKRFKVRGPAAVDEINAAPTVVIGGTGVGISGDGDTAVMMLVYDLKQAEAGKIAVIGKTEFTAEQAVKTATALLAAADKVYELEREEDRAGAASRGPRPAAAGGPERWTAADAGG